jgi:hypothetical protein
VPQPSTPRGLTAELVAQSDPEIGHELIRVHHDDGRTEELYLHDYERLYALPGVYEQIVQKRLGCRSPSQIASLLAAAVDELGWSRNEVRVLDLAAGNGVSGEALAAEGLRPVLGTDIVGSARAAVLRDRPGVYGAYLTLDLLDLSPDQSRTLAGLDANVLTCVAPVGDGPSQVPPKALAAAARQLAPDALVAYMHDPGVGPPDAVTAELWASELSDRVQAETLARHRYLHRHTVKGEPYEMDAVMWRLRRR